MYFHVLIPCSDIFLFRCFYLLFVCLFVFMISSSSLLLHSRSLQSSAKFKFPLPSAEWPLVTSLNEIKAVNHLLIHSTAVYGPLINALMQTASWYLRMTKAILVSANSSHWLSCPFCYFQWVMVCPHPFLLCAFTSCPAHVQVWQGAPNLASLCAYKWLRHCAEIGHFCS